MNSVQEQELIDYLVGIGFDGQEFTSKLREKIKLDTPSFTIGHAALFDEGKMLFDLRFRKDVQFDAYRLDGYKATLREHPPIEHAEINGIDTARLEQSFKDINWDQYFHDPKGLLTEDQQREIKSDLNDFWQLTFRPDEKGKAIQDLLQYKYWPEHAWDDGAKNFKQTYDWEREFSASEYGVCNTNLAYNILNGQLDDLFEQLERAGINQLPGHDMHADLEKILSENPPGFDLNYKRNEPDGYAEIVIPVERINGEYTIEGYTATLTPYPQLEHGSYNGIDSAKLEQQMRAIDWHNDNQLFVFHEEAEPEFRPKVGEVQEQMYRLSQDAVGAEIADKLQLKYWADATFFEDTMQQTAWDFFESLPKRTQEFPMDMNAASAINLLHGRAAINYSPNVIPPSDTNNWIRFDLKEKATNGHYPIKKIEGFSIQELENLMGLLPIETFNFYPVRNSLMRGDLTGVTFKNGMKVCLQANPEQKMLDIFTQDQRVIPFNFHFDPDWKLPQTKANELNSGQQNTQPRTPKVRLNNNYKRGKGKGL